MLFKGIFARFLSFRVENGTKHNFHHYRLSCRCGVSVSPTHHNANANVEEWPRILGLATHGEELIAVRVLPSLQV